MATFSKNGKRIGRPPKAQVAATPPSPQTQVAATAARFRNRYDAAGQGKRLAGWIPPSSGPNTAMAGLPMIRSRIDSFDSAIASTAEYLRGIWPELEGVRFEVAAAPEEAIHGDHIDRFTVIIEERRIILYRIPIQRLSKLHRNDEFHQRMMVESCVFRAVAELVGKDPWDLDPDRFRGL